MTCSRVIIINNGEISAVDTPGNLSAKMKGNERVYVEVRGDAEPATAAIKAIPGVLNVEIASNAPSQITALHVDAPVENEIRPRIVSALVAQGIDVLGLRREEMSLEDIFVELTTDEMEADGA